MKYKRLWKFLREDLKSSSGNHSWKIGEWYKEDKIDICNRGFHASKKAYQAFTYVQGEILAEVEVRGESIVQDDKECWSEMRIVKAYQWKKADSVALSIFAAEQVIKNYEKFYPKDSRPRNAIEAAKKVLIEDTKENRKAAYLAADSADSAARSAADSAADSAARSAADSAYSAADSAADSAYSAADSAARSAYSAARSAAYSAADSADSAARSAADSARTKLIASIDKWFTKHIKKLQKYV